LTQGSTLIHEIASLIKAGEVAALSEAFKLLENSLHAYFVVEESIAGALNFDFTQHSHGHQRLLKEFQKIKKDLLAKNSALFDLEVKRYTDSLRNCLIRHIKEDGKPLKAVLETQFYDFKPI